MPQHQREGNIFMDTLIGKAVVMFGINKVFRAGEGLSPLYQTGSSGMNGQYSAYPVFPEAKDVFSAIRRGNRYVSTAKAAVCSVAQW
jgi:hypothetical protein